MDWLDAVLKQKVKVKKVVEGVEKEIEETIETKKPGYLEAVYHLYSMKLKHGPVIIRMRTENRSDRNHVPITDSSMARRGSFRSARFLIFTESGSTAIPTCGGF